MLSSAEIPTLELVRRLSSPSCRCLLLGICGSGQRSLAEALVDAGHTVIGTDLVLRTAADVAAERLNDWSPQIVLIPWDADFRRQLPSCDLVIASHAIPAADARLQLARAGGVPVVSLPRAVAALWSRHQQISVAGTHGKTTTTALLHFILRHSGRNAGLYLGGRLQGSAACGRAGEDGFAVLESCEYRRSFCELSPFLAVLTGIDRDHFDTFSTPEEESAAFTAWLERSRTDATVIVNADCPRARDAAGRSGRRTVHVGDGPRHDWSVSRIDDCSLQMRAVVHGPGGREFPLTSHLPGRHNLTNTLLAVAAACELGVSSDVVESAVAAFPGVRRRFEVRGEYRGALLVDDYAHHPTAISATLSTARRVFPDRRLVVVCEPHQLSRLTTLQADFVRSLSIADECLILPVLAAREHATRGLCLRLSGELVRRVNSAGRRAFLMANLDQATARIDHAARPGDVVITLGAGRTYCIHDQLTRKLLRDTAA